METLPHKTNGGDGEFSFSEEYGRFRDAAGAVRERLSGGISEDVVQCVWYDQIFSYENLQTDDGVAISVLSPGWWNHGEGPDFKGAQLLLDSVLKAGDIEIHLDHAAWFQHGHHIDPRYDDVLLVVVLERVPPLKPPVTSDGRRIPCLLLPRYLEEDIQALSGRLLVEDYPYEVRTTAGQCSEMVRLHGAEGMNGLLAIAGEWRMLNKAQAFRERMERAGTEQAFYEAFMTACGYAHFKHHFRAIARNLPYERVRQLARQDPLLLEAAFLQIAGLLPQRLPEDSPVNTHFERLSEYRRGRLSGLMTLPLQWRRAGVRPINYPERRLAGAVRFLARTADTGLPETLDAVWTDCAGGNLTPAETRLAFEELFPAPMGYWAQHCTWNGKPMAKPCGLLGPGRIRCIVGNVFVSGALAIARHNADHEREAQILAFFSSLPKEPDNHVLKIMLPRMLGPDAVPQVRVSFRTQQGLLQIHRDWCESNPSCHNCGVSQFLSAGGFQ